MSEPRWLDGVQVEAASLLGLTQPLVFPGVLVDIFAAGTEVLALDEAVVRSERQPAPRPELGLLGVDMPACFRDYELAEYLPGAWPFALDGGGGIYCLDLRSVMSGASANDGSSPIVWSHAGNLGWRPDECLLVADPPGTLFTAALP